MQTTDPKSLTVSQSPPSLAYVTFYSDIERAVLKVTIGRMVTVAHNLHLVDPTSESGASAVTLTSVDSSDFQAKLKGLLNSPEFLPYGGTLGVGVTHRYPITFQTKLQEFASCLKGEDAHVYRTCQDLGLNPVLGMIYEDEDMDMFRNPGYGIMSDRMIYKPTYDYWRVLFDDVNSYGKALFREGGILVNIVEGVHTCFLSTWVSVSTMADHDNRGKVNGECQEGNAGMGSGVNERN